MGIKRPVLRLFNKIGHSTCRAAGTRHSIWQLWRRHYHHYRDQLSISSEGTSAPSWGGLTKQELTPKLHDPLQILPKWSWRIWTVLQKASHPDCGISTSRAKPQSSNSRLDSTKMIAQIMSAALITGQKTWSQNDWVGTNVKKRCSGRSVRKEIQRRVIQWHKGSPWSGRQPTTRWLAKNTT